VGAALLGVGLAASTGVADRGQSAPRAAQSAAPAAARPATRTAPAAPVASHALSPALSAREQSELIKTYCATCHSERAKAGGLSLAGFDAMRAHS